MKKRTLVTFLIVGLLMACGGPPAPATPAPEPAAAEPEAEEPEVAEAAEPEAAEPEAAEPEEPARAEASLPPEEPARPPCHTLEKSRCSVTQGCAWYERAGKGKCQDE